MINKWSQNHHLLLRIKNNAFDLELVIPFFSNNTYMELCTAYNKNI